MKIKVSELSGAALDWAVSEAVEVAVVRRSGGMISDGEITLMDVQANKPWSPSTDWSQGGPLIDKYDPEELRLPELGRYAEVWLDRYGDDAGVGRSAGNTRLVAFCRALVNAKLGDEIEIPERLLS